MAPIGHRRIFLSHASSDGAEADRVASALATQGVLVRRLDDESPAGKRPTDVLDAILASSDIVVMLLSPAYVASRWATEETSRTLEASLSTRAISVIPAFIEACETPKPLRRLPAIDLRAPDGPTLLADRLRSVDAIDFDRLDYRRFEDLVAELLHRSGFDVQMMSPSSPDRGWDLLASYEIPGPFGPRKEMWAVQVKRYQEDRHLGISSMRNLLGSTLGTSEIDRCLVVTTGQVTSLTRQYLADANTTHHKTIELMEGSELQARLMEHPDLVTSFFPATP